MRIAIVVAPNVGRVLGMWSGNISFLREAIIDRQANGEDFPDEHAVRLPRRFSRTEAKTQETYRRLASSRYRDTPLS